MKKFVMGIIIGVIAMLGVSAYADDAINAAKSLIGQQVQGIFPIFVQSSKLKTDVIVVDNKSYMPVRDIAELLNSNVSFIDNTVLIEPKAGTLNTAKLDSLGVTTDEMSQADKDKLAKWQAERDLNQKQDDDLKAKLKAEQDAAEANRQKALEEQAKRDEEFRKIKAIDDKKAQEAAQQQQQTQPQATSTPNP